jgi:hypothetical protein
LEFISLSRTICDSKHILRIFVLHALIGIPSFSMFFQVRPMRDFTQTASIGKSLNQSSWYQPHHLQDISVNIIVAWIYNVSWCHFGSTSQKPETIRDSASKSQTWSANAPGIFSQTITNRPVALIAVGKHISLAREGRIPPIPSIFCLFGRGGQLTMRMPTTFATCGRFRWHSLAHTGRQREEGVPSDHFPFKFSP